MRRLLLLRHAKSSWSDPSIEDHERPLAARGREDARRVAQHLQELTENGGGIDLVLCSSALRAQQTWAQVEKRVEPRFGVRVARELYMPSQEELTLCLKQVPARAKTVLLVGHNPSLEALALAIATKGDPALRAQLMEKFPTAGLCVLELEAPFATAFARSNLRGVEGRLVSLVTPKELVAGARMRRAPSKALDIDLPSKPKLASTALLVFETASAQLRENASGARQGNDPEYLHQMRVGVRRLRTALGLFEGVLGEAAEAHLEKELHWLSGVLGPLREYDVVLQDVLSPLDSARGLAAMRKDIERRRQALHDELLLALDSRRFERLVTKLAEQQAELARRAEQAHEKLKPFARKHLDKRLRKIKRLEAAVDDFLGRGQGGTARASALHALRKQLKKLRYASDFVRDAFAKQRTKHFMRRLTALQEVLGQIQDAYVSERLLARHLKQVEDRRVRANLRTHVRAPLDAMVLRATSDLEQRWDVFKRPSPSGSNRKGSLGRLAWERLSAEIHGLDEAVRVRRARVLAHEAFSQGARGAHLAGPHQGLDGQRVALLGEHARGVESAVFLRDGKGLTRTALQRSAGTAQQVDLGGARHALGTFGLTRSASLLGGSGRRTGGARTGRTRAGATAAHARGRGANAGADGLGLVVGAGHAQLLAGRRYLVRCLDGHAGLLDLGRGALRDLGSRVLSYRSARRRSRAHARRRHLFGGGGNLDHRRLLGTLSNRDLALPYDGARHGGSEQCHRDGHLGHR
ncbi:MAG: CHAD domain-containing protein [Myxococcales bacterium]